MYSQQPNPYENHQGYERPTQTQVGHGKIKYIAQSPYNDVWALILYTIVLLAFVVLSFPALQNLPQFNTNFSGSNSFISLFSVSVFLGSAGIGLLLGIGYLILLQLYKDNVGLQER